MFKRLVQWYRNRCSEKHRKLLIQYIRENDENNPFSLKYYHKHNGFSTLIDYRIAKLLNITPFGDFRKNVWIVDEIGQEREVKSLHDVFEHLVITQADGADEVADFVVGQFAIDNFLPYDEYYDDDQNRKLRSWNWFVKKGIVDEKVDNMN